MFREIKTSERNLENISNKKEEGYLKIKPTEEHSDEEWDALTMEIYQEMMAGN